MTRKIRKAAVIGSGVMGGGIAALLASAGVKTLLLDIVPFDLKEEEKTNPVARNRIAKAGLDTVLMSRPALLMHPTDADLLSIGNLEDDFDKLADCDWIVEVVVENLKIKQDLLKRIEPVRKPGSIVSSNTSGIPLKSMSEGLSDEFKQHFLGTHFFNPVRYMKLLEIIPGEKTLPDVLGFMADYGERVLGKGIVWAKDTPNFVGNRIGVQGMVKTMQLMLEDGLTIPEVDALFGPAMGRPKTAMFKTADLVGLDTALSRGPKNTYDLVADDEARDDFVMPEFVSKDDRGQDAGQKNQGRFLQDRPDARVEKNPQGHRSHQPGSCGIRQGGTALPGRRQGCQIPARKNEGRCLRRGQRGQIRLEGHCFQPDLRGQPDSGNFRYRSWRSTMPCAGASISKWGPLKPGMPSAFKESVAKMESDGIDRPRIGQSHAGGRQQSFYKLENGKPYFYDFSTGSYQAVKISDNIISLAGLKADNKTVKTCKSASLVDIGDDVYCLEFHTKMNAINGEIVDFMAECMDYVDANGAGLVIGNQAGGMPGAFSAGGDLAFMAGLAKEGKYAEIDAFLKKAQTGMQKVRYASFPVVAAPYGLTLGGGCEVCLGAADKIVAHSELYMGLVEIGVGLLPGGGGCLNLWSKMISTIPGPVTDVDLAKFFIPTFMAIAMAKVSMSAAEARANGFLGPQDRIVFNRDYLIGEAKKEVLKMVDEGYAPPVKRPIKVFGAAAQGMIDAELFNMHSAKYVSEYDAFLAKRIAYVISGGDVRTNSAIDEEIILNLEREAFVDFWKQEKTVARVEHMLTTGKPLRN
jgi:3-hydroxyacyl-CoA dehydrogenase